MTDERKAEVVRSLSTHTTVSEAVFTGRESEKDKTGEAGENDRDGGRMKMKERGRNRRERGEIRRT